MTELSPAAQAVLNAFRADWKDEHLKQDVKCLAAALQAAADQVVPPALEEEFLGISSNYGRNKALPLQKMTEIRQKLNAIADELDGH